MPVDPSKQHTSQKQPHPLLAEPRLKMAAATQPAPPNQSLYIKNLPEKWQKEDLRRQLYMLFSTYGPVLDVTTLKTSKMRGQAHVLFRDVHTATQAMRACQSADLGGREMRIAYSKNRSGMLAKLTGTVGQSVPQQKLGVGVAQPPAGFPAPPGSLPPPPSGLPPPPGMLPAKVNGAGLKAPGIGAESVASPVGQKRPREDSDDEGDAPMEEDEDDEGGEMEMSDED